MVNEKTLLSYNIILNWQVAADEIIFILIVADLCEIWSGLGVAVHGGSPVCDRDLDSAFWLSSIAGFIGVQKLSVRRSPPQTLYSIHSLPNRPTISAGSSIPSLSLYRSIHHDIRDARMVIY